MSFRSSMLMFAGLTMLSSPKNPYRTSNSMFERPKTYETPKFTTNSGNGKNQYVFETEYCFITILADNLKSANKKLKPILIENAIQVKRMVNAGILCEIKNLK